MNSLKPWVCTILVILCIYACKNESILYYPEKHPELSDGLYNKYKLRLDTAYLEENKLEIALQLSNLKGDKNKVFDMLDASIRENADVCERLFMWQRLAKENNFQINLVKADSLRYDQSILLCESFLGANAYAAYVSQSMAKEKERKANLPKEDSTKFDLVLLSKLKEIHADDQAVRLKLKNGISEAEEKRIYEEMKIIDSINLVKVSAILEKYGYPSKELVGKEGNSTIALVLHHQPDLETRYKYRPILEKAAEDGIIGKGALKMFDRRIANIELDKGIHN